MMKLATSNKEAVVWSIFKQHRPIFPHIRTDYLRRQNVVKNIIFDDGVVIVNNEYKRQVKLNKKVFKKGTYIIHQIVNSVKGNGNATKVLNRFFDVLMMLNVNSCILSVRKSNTVARKFYEKNGFKKVDTISWSNGRIKGVIYEINLKKKTKSMTRKLKFTKDDCRSIYNTTDKSLNLTFLGQKLIQKSYDNMSLSCK